MIGPISYPGTELWVGRFVEPRVAPPVQRREKVQRVERQSTMGGDSTGYQRQTIPASNPPGSRGPGRPPGPSASTSSAPPLSRNKIVSRKSLSGLIYLTASNADSASQPSRDAASLAIGSDP